MKHLKQILILFVILSMLVSCEVLPFLPETGKSTGSTVNSTTSTTRPTTSTTHKDKIEFDPDDESGPTEDP